MLTEHLVQFYGCMVPVVPWLFYLWGNEESDKWFSVLLIIAYVILKVFLKFNQRFFFPKIFHNQFQFTCFHKKFRPAIC